MPRIRGSALRLWIAAVVAVSLLFGGHLAAREETRAAVVDGVTIPKAKVETAIRFYKMAAASSGRGVSPGEESKMREEMLERLIVDQLLYAEASRRKIKVSGKEIDKALVEFKKRYRIKSEKEFKSLLKRIHKSPKALREDTRRQLMRYKLLSNKVAPKAKVSDKEAEKFYRDNVKKLFTSPKKVRISQIFMVLPRGGKYQEKKRIKSELENIRRQISRGRSFAKMAKRYSQDPSAKEGGDLGYFTEKELSRELTSVVFSMNKGEMSRVLETSRGYHLIKVTDLQKPRTIPFKEVKVQVKRHLGAGKWSKAMSSFLKGLMAKAKIKRFM